MKLGYSVIWLQLGFDKSFVGETYKGIASAAGNLARAAASTDPNNLDQWAAIYNNLVIT